MSETLIFSDRAAFRTWLGEHGGQSEGVWLLFGKPGGPGTLKAGEALEEALCFGWIDGQMQRLDDATYRKYFAPRRDNSRWSKKNRELAQKLEAQGLMTDLGRQKIARARQNGQWDAPGPAAIGEEQVAYLSALLSGHEPAHANFLAMPASVQRTYTRAYLDAKTDEGRERRLRWIVERLDQNLRPM